ncbi:phage portal protein [Desulfosporosinus sp. Sb-LF]|uniref:phage portal protein n=1 Tax=Desulfosporosinus sp. Sb-LF TaxID=2560027 RepID=UPI00107F7CD3|nr:phage portal protein [Desulfosporosinus sp. Sb-LF]TGE33333.1 phage portal protein [Desulfosporosinus sp. Sb-LF]
MKFTDRVRLAFSDQSMNEYIRDFMNGADLDEGSLNTEVDAATAMKYTAVFACNKVLAETFACMPAVLYRKDKDGEREAVKDLAIYDILHNKPNEEMSPFNFKEACMSSLNLGGNTVCERLVNGRGKLVGLYPYEHTKVEIARDRDTKKLVYTIRDGLSTKTLTRDQVFHVPNLSLDGIVGLSPISYAASAIKLGMSYEQFGVNFYKNGANPSGTFDVPGELGEESFNRLKKELKHNYAGLKRSGTPMLLEGGMKFTPHTVNPVDAQLLESKSFQAEDICRIYRVPQHLIQLLGHSTNNNIEQQSLEFVMYTMLPIFKRWEENINMQLLTDKERMAGYYIEFKMDSLLRGDAVSRATAYAQGRQWGWLSVNDIHKLENMPPIPNGDIYMQPLNMGEAGKIQQADQAKAMVDAIHKIITDK